MFIKTLQGTNLLRIQVYDYLQNQMQTGALEPGASISMNTMLKELKVSRTPLREALLLLQEQGFVTILPQRGVKINRLTQYDVKEIYEILGAIESRVIISVFCRIGKREVLKMKALNQQMKSALAKGDNVKNNQINMEFHDVFLNLSDNQRLLQYVKILKMQLYDFPRRNYGKKWNENNLKQHNQFITLIQEDKGRQAADYMRDTHWQFESPDSFKAT